MNRIARFAERGGQPLATLAASLAADPDVDLIVYSPDDGPRPDSRLIALFTGSYGIGAVVPRVVSDDRQLLEAGAMRADGVWLSRGAGSQPDDPTYGSARDVEGSAYPFWIAPRRIVAEAIRKLAPSEGDPGRLCEAITGTARAAGLRVVYEPSWQVLVTSTSDRRPPSPAPSRPRERPELLVVTGFIPTGDGSIGDEGAKRLLSSLTRLVPAESISVLSLDGARAGTRIEALRAEGVELSVGPLDLKGWFEARWAQYSHVFLSRQALRSSVREHLRLTQPQAARIFYSDSLPLRQVEAWRSVTPASDSPGLEAGVQDGLRQLSELAMWADAIWCERQDDVDLIAGLFPSHPVAALLPAIEGSVGARPHSLRSGIVVSANRGFDVVSGSEDAAVDVLEQVVPLLRRRDPSLAVTVISDDPTPLLAGVIARANARLVPVDATATVLDEARLVLVGEGFRAGGEAVILSAMARGTPFVASPHAAAALPLDHLAGLSVFGRREDVAITAWQLLTDKDRWSRFVDAMDELRRTRYSPEARAVAMRSCLARLGIAPLSQPPRWPTVPGEGQARMASRPLVPLRPELRPRGQVVGGTGPESERQRYRDWCDRHGPTREVLGVLRHEIEGFAYKPTISILMPVYNTDPDALRDAISSVRDQIYDRWQLCIADDGSTRQETLQVLSELEDDEAVAIVRLSGNSGISGATNAALELATGEFVAFLDHDDVYKPHALAQVVRWLNADSSLDLIYSDEDKLNERQELIDPHIKPDWSPDHLMSNNYVCHLMVVRRSLMDKVGGLRPAYDGSQDYDLVLRISEQTERIAHIPEPLYSWRIIAGSAAGDAGAKPYAWRAGKRALEDAIRRRGYRGVVSYTSNPGIYRSSYALPGQPKVSIIIPTKDRVDLLQPCLESILEVSSYRNFELIVVDNGTTDGATLAYLAEFPGRVIRYPHRFNYARMMNRAASSVECDALLFLNNDTRVISSDWIEALLEHAMRPEVGAVGGRLYFEDGQVQHEGIFLGVVGLAANAHYGGYWARGEYIRNTSAVTGACVMVRPTVYSLVGGNDERLRMAYNDVDLCLRIRQAGFEVVYTPYAKLYHYESATRSYREAEDQDDGPLFARRWRPREQVDPYYSPLFERDRPFVIAL